MNKYQLFTRKCFIVLIILCIASFNANAQNVVRVEYFTDTDPGFGAGNDVPITQGQQDVSVNFQFNINSLTTGFHNLYVRSLVTPYQVIEEGRTVTKGGWSLSPVRTFYKENINNVNNALSNITAGEFFIDTDPGFGNANNINVIAGNDITNLTFTFDVTALTTGFHNLYVRFRDTNGKWSTVNTRNFYKEAVSNSTNIFPNIISGEYFIDTDPGYGYASNIPVVAGSDINNLSFTFDVTALTAGFHNLYVRFKDSNGKWSVVNIRNFYKDNLSGSSNTFPAIAAGEFFIDTDPGFGNGVNIPIVQGADLNNVNFLANVTGINTGFHQISVRFRDANGRWGHTNSKSFYKEVLASSNILSNIVKVEYFVDTDPGFGNGTSVSISPSTDITSLTFPIDMTNVSIGNHKIYVRGLNAVGKWSLVNYGSFEVKPLSAIYITIGNIAVTACAGNTFNIPYSVNMAYGSNNVFSAQLSDVNGNFGNPVNIGSFTGNNNDTIRATIPANASAGNAYRIRILASSPTDTSAASSTSFAIKRVPEQTFSITGKSQTCIGTEPYSASVTEPGTVYTWALSGGGTINSTGATASINWTIAGTHTVTLTPSNNCGNGQIRSLAVTVYFEAPVLIPVILINNRNLSASNANSTTVNGYQWYMNNALIPGATNANYFAASDGTYSVAYTNTCGIGPVSLPANVTTLLNQTIVFDSIPDKVFGDAPFTVNAVASTALQVSFSIMSGPASVSNDTITINGGGIVVVRATQAGNGTYNPASADRTFIVQKAAATIALSNLSQVFTGTAKTATATTNPPGLSVTFTYNGTAIAPINAGAYEVIATINSTNYNGSATDSLRISKANQSINLAAIPDRAYGNNTFSVTVSASSGLPVSIGVSSVPADIAAASGNSITITGTGIIYVTADQSGNGNYTAAPQVYDTFNVTKGNQNIVIDNIPNKRINDPAFNFNATVSTGLPLVFSITTTPLTGVASLNGNTITLLGDTGTVTITVTQAGNQFYNAASAQRVFKVIGLSQTITFDPVTNKTFGDPVFTVNAIASTGLPVTYSIFSGPATISGNTVIDRKSVV